jgi:Rieske Fe-S protein
MEEGIRDHMSTSNLDQCAGCMSRRAFVAKSAAGAAAAAFLSACGDGIIGGTGPSGNLPQVKIKVGDFPGLASSGTLVSVDQFRVVKRTGTGTFFALDRRCTHESTPVDPNSGGLLCSNHLSRFDSDGNVIQGPATRDLTTLVTSYDPGTDLLTIG